MNRQIAGRLSIALVAALVAFSGECRADIFRLEIGDGAPEAASAPKTYTGVSIVLSRAAAGTNNLSSLSFRFTLPTELEISNISVASIAGLNSPLFNFNSGDGTYRYSATASSPAAGLAVSDLGLTLLTADITIKAGVAPGTYFVNLLSTGLDLGQVNFQKGSFSPAPTNAGGDVVDGAFTLRPVPEPGSLALLGLGILGTSAVAFRVRRNARLAA